MTNLTKLEQKYTELGKEIAKLKTLSRVTSVSLLKIPQVLKIHVADKRMQWQEAMDYAESIGMRLPTKIELQIIAESTDEFNLLGHTWSASTVSDSPANAWYVYLNYGYTYYTNKTYSRSVLCVKE